MEGTAGQGGGGGGGFGDAAPAGEAFLGRDPRGFSVRRRQELPGGGVCAIHMVFDLDWGGLHLWVAVRFPPDRRMHVQVDRHVLFQRDRFPLGLPPLLPPPHLPPDPATAFLVVPSPSPPRSLSPTMSETEIEAEESDGGGGGGPRRPGGGGGGGGGGGPGSGGGGGDARGGGGGGSNGDSGDGARAIRPRLR